MKTIFVAFQVFSIMFIVSFSENTLARTGLKTILGGEHTSKWAIPKGFKVKRTFLVQGKKTEEGNCEFEEHWKLSTGEGRIDGSEIEYDPEACRSLVVEGWSKETQEILKKRKEKERMKLKLEPRSHVIGNPVHWASYLTKMNDPIPIKPIVINSVESKILWKPAKDINNNLCAFYEYDGYMGLLAKYKQYDLTGWFNVVKDTTIKYDCNIVSLNATATFQNDIFPTCDPGTQTVYKKNYISGNPDGSSQGSSLVQRVGKSFGCTDLWHKTFIKEEGLLDTIKYRFQLGCDQNLVSTRNTFSTSVDLPETQHGRTVIKESVINILNNPILIRNISILAKGQISPNSITLEIKQYKPASTGNEPYSEHIRTDRCTGMMGESLNCVLLEETVVDNNAISCKPMYAKLTPLEI